MSQFRLARISLILAALGLSAAPALLGMAPAYAADKAPPAAAAQPPADTVRPDMYKLIDPAQMKELMAAKNFAEAQNRIDQAAALPNITPYEEFVLNRMRVALGSSSGNMAMTIPALEAVIAANKLDASSQRDYTKALVQDYYDAKAYPKAIETINRYQSATGDMKSMHQTLLFAEFFGGDYAATKAEIEKDLAADREAHLKPDATELKLLGNLGLKLKDNNKTTMEAVELNVTYYPSDDYWSYLLSRAQGQDNFSQRLIIDLRRLQMLTVSKLEADDYMDLAELAQQGGFFTEAKKALDAGYAAGALGTGADAGKQKKLRDQVNKAAADDEKNIGSGEAAAMKSKDGVGLVNLGYAYVTMGQFDKGIDLMQKGIAKGVLKNPEDAKLRLGYAYVLAGRKDDATKALEAIQGNDGHANIAHYWLIWMNRDVTTALPTASASAAVAKPAEAKPAEAAK